MNAARILIVEDQEDNRTILRDLLASAGFDLLEAADGEEGVRAATATSPSPSARASCSRRCGAIWSGAAPAVREPPLILVVDDHADNREILEARLASRGYATAAAADGEAAIDAARAFLPDLILLDVMMPRLDGFEVCRRLKGDPSLPYMPIILETAKTALRVRRRKTGMLTKAMPMITLRALGPLTATSARARMKTGKD